LIRAEILLEKRKEKVRMTAPIPAVRVQDEIALLLEGPDEMREEAFETVREIVGGLPHLIKELRHAGRLVGLKLHVQPRISRDP
jgi:hypothetical protein